MWNKRYDRFSLFAGYIVCFVLKGLGFYQFFSAKLKARTSWFCLFHHVQTLWLIIFVFVWLQVIMLMCFNKVSFVSQVLLQNVGCTAEIHAANTTLVHIKHYVLVQKGTELDCSKGFLLYLYNGAKLNNYFCRVTYKIL